MDPKDLIDRAKGGDTKAFGILYKKFYTPVYRYILLRVYAKQDAEDLTQQTFLKIYLSIEKYQRTDSELLAYFYTVARNCVIDFFRKRSKSPFEKERESFEAEDAKINLEEDLQRKQDYERVLKALYLLPEDQREVIILKFIEDLPNSMIAKIVKKKEPALRQIQHRALVKLKNLLSEGEKTNG